MGHHDAAFTVRTYVHPQADDLPDPDEVWGDTPDATDDAEAALGALGAVGEA